MSVHELPLYKRAFFSYNTKAGGLALASGAIGCEGREEARQRINEWRNMAKINLKALLDAGMHFGHQTRRWNPKMKPYIFGSRGDIYIIDLKQSLYGLDAAYSEVKRIAEKGGTILFVGTKKQAQESIAEAANRCGMPYVNSRWLGGMLTNFVTIRSRVQRMEELEAMEADGRMEQLPKKEQILLKKELAKLQTNLNGIRNMKRIPDAIFVVDTNREQIAIHEARRLSIPIIGTLDTNCDPDDVDFGIPLPMTRSVLFACCAISSLMRSSLVRVQRSRSRKWQRLPRLQLLQKSRSLLTRNFTKTQRKCLANRLRSNVCPGQV